MELGGQLGEVAIVGMAGRFPGADTLDELWQNLENGVESVRPLSDEELLAAGLDAAAIGQPDLVKAIAMPRHVDQFDAEFFGYSHRDAEIMDPQHRLLLECAWEALEDAGYRSRMKGTIGVFAGASTSTYLLFHVLADPAIRASLDPLYIDTANSRDYLTTRISHKLGLRGPSYLVQSACSTALVAIHAACQSLLAEECDMALAGAASINVEHFRGYRYQEHGIVSPDGHCRAFDARARGTIVSNGLGLVVLKRLADALADGDSIRAVIKGSAVNNDGERRAGYTAPGVDGQADVIAEALARSGVSPTDIAYLEAHGTATPLGDTIEVMALNRVFGAEGPPCALGAVKTNLGHLATAAGIAGLFKTVLALEHRTIPPSLHFDTPNPAIDFAAGRFFVNTELRPWPATATPRRAGVSSFGLGGTNCHMVLEEAPAPLPATVSPRPHQLLLLSAKTPQALAAATANLARHLGRHPELDLADVACTLHRGREPWPHRRALVCRDREDAIARLGDPQTAGVLTGGEQARGRQPVFLLPGVGEQHLQMARAIYDAEPAFRAEVDRSCELLERWLGVDLREVLFAGPPPAEPPADAAPAPDLRRLLAPPVESTNPAQRRLDRTLFAQPAVFVVEHALARLWMSWGITPVAMIGYSLGEVTAACLAGVLCREDALRLVAERARLIDELPPGAMVAVALPASELLTLLGSGLSLAAVNTPEISVVAGTEEAVSRLEGQLTERDIACRRVRTGHALHSPLMEPVAERLTACLRSLALRPPEIPFISNLTGTWITPREAMDPQYWVRHLCQPVQLAAGLAELLREGGQVFLEVGPGQALSTFVRQHPAGAGAIAVPSLDDRPGAAQATLLRAVGRLWIEGIEVDPARFYGHERRRRVPLPTYPFERRRYWIPAGAAAARLAGVAPLAEQGDGERAPAPQRELSKHARPALRNAYVEPRDTAERSVAAVWQTLLGVDEIGVHDDFFELGGHSLLATRLASELRQRIGFDVPMRELFETPTVAGFAAVIRAEEARQGESPTRESPLPQITPDIASRHLHFPLTDVQQAYLVGRGDAFALGQVATHLYTEVDVRGLDLARLTEAFRSLIRRHDMLRAVVHLDGQQEILAEVPPFEIRTLDLRHDPEPVTALEAIRREMSHQVLPSDRWPLFELRASVLDGERTRLHFSFDFLIGDAWSWHILLHELSLAYDRRQPEPPALALSFRDYVLATAVIEESPVYQRALAYWTSRLSDLPPAPDLMLAKSPGTIRRPTFARLSGHLGTEAWQRLKQTGARHGLTPSGVLLAAFTEVLALWARSPRFAITLTLFNRLPLHPEVEQIVGDFTSLTLLAVDNSGADPFAERAGRMQRQLLEDLDHSQVSGVRVLREIARQRAGRAPLTMPIVFTSTLNQPPLGEALAGLGIAAEWGYAISQTPQVWLDHQVFEDTRGLSYNWDFVAELFPPDLIEEMQRTYQGLLASLSEQEALWQEIRPVLPPQHQLELFAAANATAADLPEGLLHEPVLAMAARAPQRTAVIAAGRTLTYGELVLRARALARRLRVQGATPGSLVAVVMAKGWEQVVGALAILISGATYLPIDPDLPRERRFLLLANGGVTIVLTQEAPAARLEWPPEVQCLAVPDDAPDEDDDEPLAPVQTPRDLAYVMYTSGSTGQPKGVMIEHQAALNTVIDVNERFRVGADDRVLALSSLSFDLSVYDLFGLLAAGGAVVLPDPAKGHDPQHWAELIDLHGVTVWNTVPALMEMMADYSEMATECLLPSLRLVLLSGDWIPLRLPDRIRELASGVEVVSLGGATEASIWSICFPIGEVAADWRSVPYGRPMKNQQVHVRDKMLVPRPVWATGDLYVGGAGLARGYWRDPGRTAQSFVAAPGGGERLYRTGDLGRYLPDGTIEIQGREDFQVKIGGFRIELGEIEAALARQPGVREAVVVAHPGSLPGDKRLIAYFVADPEAAPTRAELRESLASQLPAYMVPADYLSLSAMPLTANGKVDRGALPVPARGGDDAVREYVAPRNDVERVVAQILSEALGRDRIGVHDSFFDLGGDSLLAVRTSFRLRKALEIELPVRTFFEAPTVEELSRHVEEMLIQSLEGLSDEEVRQLL